MLIMISSSDRNSGMDTGYIRLENVSDFPF